jgi:hypothetical protein
MIAQKGSPIAGTIIGVSVIVLAHAARLISGVESYKVFVKENDG